MERQHYSCPADEPEPQRCPFVEIEQGVVSSTNADYLQEMKINALAPAANMRRVSTGERSTNERFVSWFAPDAELARAVKLRQAIFLSDPDRVLHTGKKGTRKAIRAASQQLLELQATYLTTTFPELYAIETDPEFGQVIINKATEQTEVYSLYPSKDDWHPLAISGLLGQEDICIVREEDDGRCVFVAGFLATPTNWNLSDFIGEDMDGIHRRVKDYRTGLKNTVDRSLASLPSYPERQIARNNIFLTTDPSLALDPQAPSGYETPRKITDPGSEIFMRSERETLTRLQATEAFPEGNKYIVFTIKPNVYPLAEVTDIRGDDLARALATNAVLKSYKKTSKKARHYIDRSTTL